MPQGEIDRGKEERRQRALQPKGQAGERTSLGVDLNARAVPMPCAAMPKAKPRTR